MYNKPPGQQTLPEFPSRRVDGVCLCHRVDVCSHEHPLSRTIHLTALKARLIYGSICNGNSDGRRFRTRGEALTALPSVSLVKDGEPYRSLLLPLHVRITDGKQQRTMSELLLQIESSKLIYPMNTLRKLLSISSDRKLLQEIERTSIHYIKVIDVRQFYDAVDAS